VRTTRSACAIFSLRDLRVSVVNVTAATSIRDILLKLCRREDLTRAEAREAFSHIMSGEASEAQIGGLLVGRRRGLRLFVGGKPA